MVIFTNFHRIMLTHGRLKNEKKEEKEKEQTQPFQPNLYWISFSCTAVFLLILVPENVAGVESAVAVAVAEPVVVVAAAEPVVVAAAVGPVVVVVVVAV